MGRVSPWLERRLPWLAAALALAGVVALLIGHTREKHWVADGTTLGLLVSAIVLLFAVLAPRHTGQTLRRISTFKFAGLELGLGELKRAALVRPLPGEDDGVTVAKRPVTGNATSELRAVVDRLKSRLRFVWDILKLKPTGLEKEDYAGIVRHLREQDLLTGDEKTFALDLLEGTEIDFAELSAQVGADFLDAAWEFGTRFGPLIWDRHVRRELARSGWFVADYRQTPGHRPSFIAHHGGRWAVMAARVAGTEKHPSPLTRSKNTLRRYPQEEFVEARCIVIPDIRGGNDDDEDVHVLKLGRVLDEPGVVFGEDSSAAQ